MSKNSGSSASLVISWKAIAVSGICTTLALAVSLAVVTATKNLDYLATLALALAVVAFVVQIIVFVAQTSASSQQLARGEELHGLTVKALASIEEKAEGTRQTVNVMNSQMLAALVGKSVLASGAAQDVDIASLTASISEALSGNDDAPSSVRRRRAPVPPRSTVRLEPDLTHDAEQALVHELSQLSDESLLDLERLGRDHQLFANSHVGPGIKSISEGPVLYESGLVRRVASKGMGGEPVFVLTAKGRDAAALILHAAEDGRSPEAVALSARVAALVAARERSLAEYRRRIDEGVPVSED